MYGRGEYQHAPAVPVYPAKVEQFEAKLTGVPVPFHGNAETNVFA